MSEPNALTARLTGAEPCGLAAYEPARLQVPARGLADDFARCKPLRQVELDWFRERGVSGFALLGYRIDPAAIGVAQFRRAYPGWPPVDLGFEVRRARVEFLPRQRFIFEWDKRADTAWSEPALVIPALEDGAVVDLIAWQPKTGRLASLDRRAGCLVGQSDFADEAVLVHPTPLSWLAACRVGVVVVHETLARPFLLAQPALKASDVAHGLALKAMLSKVRLPSIQVPADSIGKAAA